MQLKKGLRKGKQTYLATVVVDKEVGKELVPTTIQAVLYEYKEVMPDKLPHELPPLWGVKHEIELFLRVKPPAKGPYRTAPPELVKLRKQLDELLEAGYVCPSKAPLGTPVLFQKKHDESLRMKFVEGYSRRTTPMTELLKKGHGWNWTEECQGAFDDLKDAMMRDPVLALPDVMKPFEVQTDASDFALGRVLVQEGHLVVYESRKLSKAKRKYTS
ncbi:uncharacterized protein LOC131156129 [Malania oleifera]|uniref:uncharacterized protein LOC131156129 n=1 Tax=Malania oleifera TaxID=397392 RepID=UPI0025ADEE5C|nr:uncharacterized protein LOC131156129 [Malania oleifera]